ncbi:uncharacterized protein [Nicotiana tomentosiformis]|uniref:uncharacterized protein n=1 Tax=Nicotiana tomentosiformis TaxID=4098 RepID=UPI00388C68D3
MSSKRLKRLDKFTMLFLIHFGGTPSEDPQDFLEHCHELFLEKFIPFTQREDLRSQFDRLQQGNMTVTKYQTKFVYLSCHAIILIPTERERVERFIDGLTYGIRLQMARKTEDDISFTRVMEIARWTERIRGQGREVASEKWPRHFGGFSGASSGNKCSFSRGHSIRLVQSALQVSHGASDSRGSYEVLNS